MSCTITVDRTALQTVWPGPRVCVYCMYMYQICRNLDFFGARVTVAKACILNQTFMYMHLSFDTTVIIGDQVAQSGTDHLRQSYLPDSSLPRAKLFY